MVTKEKDIKEIIPLKKIPAHGSHVIGITNLSALPEISTRDVRDSRGEFA